MQDVIVAAVNMRCVPGRTRENLRNIERWCSQAAGEGAQIVCLPEMGVCGYDSTSNVRAVAETIPGPATDEVVRMAADLKMTILAGLAEKGGQGDLYISHFVATPAGVTGVYRKTHLGPTERAIFRAGERIDVFQHDKCRFGLQLCFEGHFPEISTLQALQGAEVLFIPHATPREQPQEKRDRMVRYLPSRAYDNTCYVVSCNHVGKERSGKPLAGVALIVDPKGVVIAEAAGWDEAMVVATLHSEPIERIKNSEMGWFLGSRRPDLYDAVSDSSKILV